MKNSAQTYACVDVKHRNSLSWPYMYKQFCNPSNKYI